MAQDKPNMVQTLVQHGPKCPNIAQNGPRQAQCGPNSCPTKANRNHKIPLKWLNIAQYGANAGPTSQKRATWAKMRPTEPKLHPPVLQIKNWVCTRSMPPPHPPPRAKLHQLLALFQRFPSPALSVIVHC